MHNIGTHRLGKGHKMIAMTWQFASVTSTIGEILYRSISSFIFNSQFCILNSRIGAHHHEYNIQKIPAAPKKETPVLPASQYLALST